MKINKLVISTIFQVIILTLIFFFGITNTIKDPKHGMVGWVFAIIFGYLFVIINYFYLKLHASIIEKCRLSDEQLLQNIRNIITRKDEEQTPNAGVQKAEL